MLWPRALPHDLRAVNPYCDISRNLKVERADRAPCSVRALDVTFSGVTRAKLLKAPLKVFLPRDNNGLVSTATLQGSAPRQHVRPAARPQDQSYPDKPFGAIARSLVFLAHFGSCASC